MSYKKCNNCLNSNRLKAKFCDCCGSQDLTEINENNWLTKYANEPSNWLDNIQISSLPLVLNNEYKRLKEMAENDERYGILLQIRDVGEIMLKLPILVYSVNNNPQIYDGKDKETNEDKYLPLWSFMNNEMTLGSWIIAAARLTFEKGIKHEAISVLRQLQLKNSLFFYDKEKKVTAFNEWRNNEIGHGALGYADNEDFGDVLHMLNLITETLKKTIDDYNKLKDSINTESAPRIIYYDNMNPSHVYFYDSRYKKHGKLTDSYYYICYTEGKKTPPIALEDIPKHENIVGGDINV